MTRPSRRHRPAARTEPEHRRAVQQHTLTLPNTAASVSLARRTAQMAFTTWGLPATSTVDAALLITTELVANTVRHATRSPQLNLTIDLDAQQLTIAVHDEEPGPATLAADRHHPGGPASAGEPDPPLRRPVEPAPRLRRPGQDRPRSPAPNPG